MFRQTEMLLSRLDKRLFGGKYFMRVRLEHALKIIVKYLM